MSGDVSDQAHELGRLIREVASAFTQVVKTGSEAQMGEARKVLTTTRKDLYRILADGDPGEGDSEAGIVGEDACEPEPSDATPHRPPPSRWKASSSATASWKP